jgi:excisionase family DNA binding protein
MAHPAITDTVVPAATRDLIACEIARQLARIEDDPWLSPQTAAERANCSRAHLLRCIRQGEGPTVAGSGRMMRMRQSAVDRWLERRGEGPGRH